MMASNKNISVLDLFLKIQLFLSIQIDRSTRRKKDRAWGWIFEGHVLSTLDHQTRSTSTTDGAREDRARLHKTSNQMLLEKVHCRRRCSIVSECWRQKVQESSLDRPWRNLMSPIQQRFHTTFHTNNLNFTGALHFYIGSCKGQRVCPSLSYLLSWFCFAKKS
jgi:hypothetical protein